MGIVKPLESYSRQCGPSLRNGNADMPLYARPMKTCSVPFLVLCAVSCLNGLGFTMLQMVKPR